VDWILSTLYSITYYYFLFMLWKNDINKNKEIKLNNYVLILLKNLRIFLLFFQIWNCISNLFTQIYVRFKVTNIKLTLDKWLRTEKYTVNPMFATNFRIFVVSCTRARIASKSQICPWNQLIFSPIIYGNVYFLWCSLITIQKPRNRQDNRYRFHD